MPRDAAVRDAQPKVVECLQPNQLHAIKPKKKRLKPKLRSWGEWKQEPGGQCRLGASCWMRSRWEWGRCSDESGDEYSSSDHWEVGFAEGRQNPSGTSNANAATQSSPLQHGWLPSGITYTVPLEKLKSFRLANDKAHIIVENGQQHHSPLLASWQSSTERPFWRWLWVGQDTVPAQAKDESLPPVAAGDVQGQLDFNGIDREVWQWNNYNPVGGRTRWGWSMWTQQHQWLWHAAACVQWKPTTLHSLACKMAGFPE